MTPMQMRRVRSALRKLGPKRVKRGLAAFRSLRTAQTSFRYCFLGRAYGRPGALEREAYSSGYASALGLTMNEMWDTAMAFDREPSVLRDLAKTFLETSHANRLR